jgi:deoxyribonuclease V
MNLAVDVHYRKEDAVVAGVTFADWHTCEPDQTLITQLSRVASYEPGQFYKRELPCILELLKQVNPLPNCIVIDGYVYLGSDAKPGLGKHLYDALQGQCVIIGVAKKRFKGTPVEAELFRGDSRRPLYVTSAGIDQAEAKQCIKNMCGVFRIPTLLKKVDQLCRGSTTLNRDLLEAGPSHREAAH